MLFTGHLSSTAQASTPVTDATRVRLGNLGVVLAVAEIASTAPVSQNNPNPITARVLALAPTATGNQQHSVQVEINGQTLWVKMLQTPQIGEQLQLRFTDAGTLERMQQSLNTSGSPLPTNSTATDLTQAATQATAKSTNNSATSTVATVTPSSNSGQSTAQVSAFGNLVNQLLSRIDQHVNAPPQLSSLVSSQTAAQLAAQITSRSGVQSALPAQLASEQLASGMHQAVEKSGVFYESHLHAWTRNERSLEQIQQEPQTRHALAEAASKTSDARSSNLPANTNDYMPADKLLPILREQMQVLEQRQFTAQMEVWPRQMAQLTIADESTAQQPDSSGESTPWRAQLKLHLPHLGMVDASLQIQGQNVRLSLQAGDEHSAEELRHHALDLQQALHTSGLQLTRFQVQVQAPS